jgi:hypothetical protein
MLIDTLPAGVDTYSRVEWREDQWDIMSRPAPRLTAQDLVDCRLDCLPIPWQSRRWADSLISTLLGAPPP